MVRVAYGVALILPYSYMYNFVQDSQSIYIGHSMFHGISRLFTTYTALLLGYFVFYEHLRDLE